MKAENSKAKTYLLLDFLLCDSVRLCDSEPVRQKVRSMLFTGE
jgi:hypothetical protein